MKFSLLKISNSFNSNKSLNWYRNSSISAFWKFPNKSKLSFIDPSIRNISFEIKEINFLISEFEYLFIFLLLIKIFPLLIFSCLVNADKIVDFPAPVLIINTLIYIINKS